MNDKNKLTLLDVEDSTNHILSTVSRLLEKNELLMKENLDLRSEHFKDDELTKMNDALSEMRDSYYRGFPLTIDEENKIKEWQDQHLANRHHAKTLNEKLKMGGVSGGIWSYNFTPTSIGTFSSCRCNNCYNKAIDAHFNAGKDAKLQDFIKKYDAAFYWEDV